MLPSEVVLSLLTKRLAQRDCVQNGWILDGKLADLFLVGEKLKGVCLVWLSLVQLDFLCGLAGLGLVYFGPV